VLRDAKIPVHAFGKGWDTHDDRAEYARTLVSAAALLHVFPDQRRVHGIDFAGRPVIRPGLSSQEMIRRCRDALRNPPSIATTSANFICASLIRELVAAIS
jgi:hypothetical protein